MHKRPATDRTEIDFLPPFGEPEVITTGSAAADVAVAGTAAAISIAAISELSSN